MKISKFHKTLNILVQYISKGNFLNFKNLILILYYIRNSIQAFIRREKNFASEIYWTEKNLFVDQKDPIKFIEDRRKVKDVFPYEILDEFNKLKKNFKVNVLDLLEIGSGTISNIAYYVDQKLINVTAIDPLANEYKRMLKKVNYNYPIKPIKLKGEDLLRCFKEKCFHIIFALNSLDHTENPIKCLDNAYQLLMPGGIIFIVNNVKEGSRQNWMGLHQHDIYVKDNELIVSDKMGAEKGFFNKNKHLLELIYYEEYKIENDIGVFKIGYRKVK